MVFYQSLCLGAVGLQMMALALIGHRICAQCFDISVVTIKHKKRLFTFLSSVSIFCIVIFSSSLTRSLELISSQASYSMDRGMTVYLTDKVWRKSMDQMQSQLKCCGGNNYTDWFKTSWVPIEALNWDVPNLDKYVHPNGRVTLPLLPFSCCRADYLGVCQHDLLIPRVTTPDTASYYTQGCVGQITRELTAISDVLMGLALLYAMLTLAGGVLLQFVYTSSRNAVILERDEVPGWLFGPEDVGYGREDTLTSIDAALVVESTKSINSTQVTPSILKSNRNTPKESRNISNGGRNGRHGTRKNPSSKEEEIPLMNYY